MLSNCDDAISELDADKDKSDLKECPAGYTTKIEMCTKDNWWGDQYVKKCIGNCNG